MLTTKAFSIEQLKAVDDTQYGQVEAYGGVVDLGSLCSEDMIEWLEDNDDETKKKEAGLRLLVKSIGEAERDEAGNVVKFTRIPKEQHDEVRALFRKKDAVNNGKVIRAILELNGLGKKIEGKTDELKNDSGEVTPAASPIASPSPSVE